MPISSAAADIDPTIAEDGPDCRYGLYFAPASDSALWIAGSRWIGRNAKDDRMLPQVPVAGIREELLHALTSSACRYGFHATLKAPFRLAPGFRYDDLLAMAEAFCQAQVPLSLPGLAVRRLDDFLALCPVSPAPDIDALAMRCVRYFDRLRAPPDAAELARRRALQLNARQEALLQRWGYPFTEEEFRFHLTLTDRLQPAESDVATALQTAAEHHFAPVLAAPVPAIDALSIFRQPSRDAPFSIVARLPFSATARRGGLPRPGHLFYVVGASGVGKDSLLRWVREKSSAQPAAAAAQVAFMRRTITRAAHPSEDHEPIDASAFRQQAEAGAFSMTWHANGVSYGIRRNLEAALAAGKHVVVNGSREHVPEVLRAFPQATVVWITAAAQTIAERLQARQRESGEALRERLARGSQFTVPADARIVTIDNGGAIATAGEALMALLAGEPRV